MSSSSDSLTTIDVNSYDGQNYYCQVCNKKVDVLDRVKLNYFESVIDDQLIIDETTYKQIDSTVHKKCMSLKHKHEEDNNYLNKYIKNIKKYYCQLIVLFLLLIMMLSVAIYNCYHIIDVERYLLDDYTYNCNISTWAYDVHFILIINVLLLSFVGVFMLFKVILLVFR
jgi:hypothetical protein